METQDRDLLERFVASRDETAFATLVRRHAPLVLGVCRRILGSAEDAEDAFQATFIVLSKKASSIKNLDSISSWLHGVAVRISHKAKAIGGERRHRERRIAQMTPPSAPELQANFEELKPALDQELSTLPEKYRKALVLCYLEGKTNEAAARELGWPVGSIFQRLEKARELLRHRLLGRGVAVTSAVLLSLLMEKTLFAATAAPALVASTSKIAVLALAGEAGVAAPVALLVKATLKGLFAAKMKVAAAAVLAVTLVGSAAGVASYRVFRTESIEDPAEVAQLERRISELQPSPAERRMDEIGWAPDLATAVRLAKETGRPLVIVAHVGDLATGRFDGGGVGARGGLLSDSRVISLLNRAFVCVYVSQEDFAEQGRATPAEKAEMGRIYHEALAANLQAGDESIYLVGPDGRILDLLPADASPAIPILERARDRYKPREGGPVVKPRPQSRPPAHSRDDLVLHLVARYVDATGAPEKDRQSWHELPAENWLVFKPAEWSRLLPGEESRVGMTWTPAPDVARQILIHFYPTTEDLLRDDAGRSKVESVSLQGRVVAIPGATVRARLEGKIRMLRRFHVMQPQYAPNVLEATVSGFLEFEPSGRILWLKMTTGRATFGDSPFSVAVRSQ
jgi:RNA polymerase sigma factor (sigma-70 family)